MKRSVIILLVLVSSDLLADKPAETAVVEAAPTEEIAIETATGEEDAGTDDIVEITPDEITAQAGDITPHVAPPSPFMAIYSARVSAARGETTMTLMPVDDSRFRFHSKTEARGIARMLRSEPIIECSEFRLAERGNWQAQTYVYRDGRKDSDISFDVLNAVANTRYRDESDTLPITRDTTDRLLEQLLISRAIVDDEALSTRQVIDRGSLQTIEWQFVGKERISVDAGSFETVKYRRTREGSKRSSLIWFAPALDGLPVRIEQYRLDDRQARAELKRYLDAATLQARGTVTPVCP